MQRSRVSGSARRSVAAVAVFLLATHSAGAQRSPGWSLGLGFGVAVVGTRGGGNPLAAHTSVGLVRPVSRNAQAIFSVDAFGMGGAEAAPSCIPGTIGGCQARTIQPDFLLGTSAGMQVHPFGGGVGLSGLVGGYFGPSIKGSQPTSSVAFSGGLEYEVPWKTRMAPTIGFRYVRFTTPLANVRWIMAPGAGFTF